MKTRSRCNEPVAGVDHECYRLVSDARPEWEYDVRCRAARPRHDWGSGGPGPSVRLLLERTGERVPPVCRDFSCVSQLCRSTYPIEGNARAEGLGHESVRRILPRHDQHRYDGAVLATLLNPA